MKRIKRIVEFIIVKIDAFYRSPECEIADKTFDALDMIFDIV